MLRRRGTSYVSRIFVPVELRQLVGRGEFVRSLRTAALEEAEHRRTLWEAHLGTYLATIRMMGSGMTRTQLDEITRRYLEVTFEDIEERLALTTDTIAREVRGFDLVDEAYRLSGLLTHGEVGDFLPLAQDMLPQADDLAHRKLARRLIEAKLEAVKAEIGALNGAPLAMPLGATSGTPQGPADALPLSVTPLSEVVEVFAADHLRRKKWTPKTEILNRGILAVVVGLLGDRPIGDVSKADVRAFGEALTQYPSNAAKVFPGASPKEALERAKGRAVEPLAPRSVNRYQQQARSLFLWAMDNDYLRANPFAILKDVAEPRARDDRKPFTDEDLRAYFAVLEKDKEPAFLWIARILAYSGMRLGEAAKLRRADVRQEGAVWIFDVNEEGEGRRLKNEASRRLVPVHPRLVELGLLQLIEGRPEGFLWPERFRTANSGRKGDADTLSGRLSYRLRKYAGITDEKKTAAHSFRHTLAARLQNAGVPDYQIADILGHENDSMSTGRYGDRADVRILSSAVELVKLPI